MGNATGRFARRILSSSPLEQAAEAAKQGPIPAQRGPGVAINPYDPRGRNPGKKTPDLSSTSPSLYRPPSSSAAPVTIEEGARRRKQELDQEDAAADVATRELASAMAQLDGSIQMKVETVDVDQTVIDRLPNRSHRGTEGDTSQRLTASQIRELSDLARGAHDEADVDAIASRFGLSLPVAAGILQYSRAPRVVKDHRRAREDPGALKGEW